MLLQRLSLNTDIMQLIKSGEKILLVSEFDYCIAYLAEDNKIRDYQTNVLLNLRKHKYNKVCILLDEVPKEIVCIDIIEKLFHLSAIKVLEE